MNILLTGATGLLGKALVPLLKQCECNVFLLSRNKTIDEGYDTIIPMYFSEIRTINYEKILEGIDIVVHMLWTSLPRNDMSFTKFDINQNLLKGIDLIDGIIKNKVRKIIFISSGGAVYGGDSFDKPIPENTPCKPISSYGLCKKAFEDYLQMYTQKYYFQSVSLRVSPTYGAYQNTNKKQGVISTWLKNVIKNKPIEIWGDGNIIRDYIYVKDVAKAIVASIDTDVSGVFNIGQGIGYSLNDLVEIIQTVTNKEMNIVRRVHNMNDPSSIILDISKAFQYLHWKPLYSLQEGIVETYKQLSVI